MVSHRTFPFSGKETDSVGPNEDIHLDNPFIFAKVEYRPNHFGQLATDN